MASPHAVGVAALVVAEYGARDPEHGGLTLDPAQTEAIMREQATDTPCPAQNPLRLPAALNPAQYTARVRRARRSATGSTATASSTPPRSAPTSARPARAPQTAVPRGRRETGALARSRARDDVA